MATGEEDGDGGMVSEMHTVGGGGGRLYQSCLHRKRAAPPRSKDGGCANLIAAPPSLIRNNPLMMYISITCPFPLPSLSLSSRPHTSYWDSFYIYMVSLSTLGFGLTKANWMGKFFVYWLPVWTVVRNKEMSQTKTVAKHFDRWVYDTVRAAYWSPRCRILPHDLNRQRFLHKP